MKRKYDTAADSADTRNTVGAIYAAMKRLGCAFFVRGWISTLRRYVRHVEANIPAVLSPGTAGLSPDQRLAKQMVDLSSALIT